MNPLSRLWQGSTGPVIVVVAAAMSISLSSKGALASNTFDDGFVGDFYVAAILTTDSEQYILQEWGKPKKHIPHYLIPFQIKPDKSVKLLIFYSNPTVVNGSIDLICDADMFHRGRRIEPDPPRVSCFTEEPILPPPGYLGMANYSFEFSFPRDQKLPQEIMVRLRVSDVNISKAVFLELNVKVADE